jgi:hypothetical protein
MAGVLGFVFDKKQVNEGFSALMNEMNVSSESYGLVWPTAFGPRSSLFKPEFLENMKKIIILVFSLLISLIDLMSKRKNKSVGE